MTACTVIALLGIPASGAAGTAAGPSTDSRAQALVSRVTAPVQTGAEVQSLLPSVAKATARACPNAHKAVRFYRTRVDYWRDKMGAPAIHRTPSRLTGCPRYLAHVLQRKAYGLRKAYANWFFREYRWDHWLPAKFYRVARCETGVRWDWDSGTYVSAFGIIRVAYEWYHPWTGHNTPREQYEVAAAIQRRFGWSAWGCGGA